MGGPEIKTGLFMQTTLIKTAPVKNSYLELTYEIKTLLPAPTHSNIFLTGLNPNRFFFIITIFQAIRCTVPECSCECFVPGKRHLRYCETCKHGWVPHGE